MERLWTGIRWVLVFVEIVAVVLLVCWGVSIYYDYFAAGADGTQEEVWVLCAPGSCVNLREKPKGRVFGGVEAGARFWADREKDGWIHVSEVPAEMDQGWISTRYIVYDEPRIVNCALEIRAEGRVACRQWIGGKVVKWLQPGESCTVYYQSNEWSCTEYGYIKTEYLEEVQG